MGRKLKEKQRKFLKNKKAFIFTAILCMGIGFAFLSSNLTITGNTSVSGNSWNVYFTNVQVNEASVDASVVPTTSGTTTTSLDYTVTLDKPGDFYEFSVDAVNDGTIDAMIESINMTSLDTDVAKYLSYTATYEDGTAIAKNDILVADYTTTYKIRVEFKKNIEPNDLSENNINLTLTFGVNYVQSTIKPKRFIELIKDSALSDDVINFGNISSASNGRGLYVMNSTTEDDYPIYYYRGAVENNNVKFADFCWKIVRTTETGGTKLVYNGEANKVYKEVQRMGNDSYENVINDVTYPFTFDSLEKNWFISGTTNWNRSTLAFTVKEEGDYYLNYKVEPKSETSRVDIYATFYKDGVAIGRVSGIENGKKILLRNLTPSNIISIEYENYSYEDSRDGTLLVNLEKGVGNSVLDCDITNEYETQINSIFNSNSNSLAYNGYMYGNVYENEQVYANPSYLYGNAFTYSNGIYTLVDTQEGIDDTHHYTCLSSGTTCESVKYVYFLSYGTAYCITLTGGKSVEDAIREMQTNTNDSTVKATIDNWFNNKFQNYFITKNKNYNDYLEDTVWCNDRSMNTLNVTPSIGGSAINNGWKSNGGSLNAPLSYGPYGRMKVGSPDLMCPNKNDSFTVTESAIGNGALTYPVGLLTLDEIILAGGQFASVANLNEDFYLYTNLVSWTMSPFDFAFDNITESIVAADGYFTNSYVYNNNGVRPSISIKSGVKVAIGGNGTAVAPYEFIVG